MNKCRFIKNLYTHSTGRIDLEKNIQIPFIPFIGLSVEFDDFQVLPERITSVMWIESKNEFLIKSENLKELETGKSDIDGYFMMMLENGWKRIQSSE